MGNFFTAALRKQACFEKVPASVWEQDWVVHCKPVGGGGSALKYLASYVLRVAISNHRLLRFSNGQVTFRYQDTATGKRKTCTLSALEFMRRFLQHVLTKGFVKVRYYGFYSPENRPLLAEIQQHLRLAFPQDYLSMTAEAQPIKTDFDFSVSCQQCGQTMVFLKTIPRHERSPPQSGFMTWDFSPWDLWKILASLFQMANSMTALLKIMFFQSLTALAFSDQYYAGVDHLLSGWILSGGIILKFQSIVIVLLFSFGLVQDGIHDMASHYMNLNLLILCVMTWLIHTSFMTLVI